MLEQLTDTQRRMLLIGVPIVGALAVGARLARGGGDASKVATADDSAGTSSVVGSGAIGPFAAPSTDAIGVGQLGSFESDLTDLLNGISEHVKHLDRPQGPSVTPPATVTTAEYIKRANGNCAAHPAALANRHVSVNDPRLNTCARRNYALFLLGHHR